MMSHADIYKKLIPGHILREERKLLTKKQGE